MRSIIHYRDGVRTGRMRKVGAASCACALLLPVAACGGSDDQAGGASSSPSAAAVSSAPPATGAGCAQGPATLPANAVTIDVPPATVTVDQPGAGERGVRAVRPTATASWSLFTNSLQVSATQGGAPSGGNRDVTLPIVAQPTCADPLQLDIYLGAPTSSDPALTEALAVERGQRILVRLAASGEVRSFSLAAPTGVEPQAQSAVEQALLQTFLRVIPLPAEPVGNGARWTVRRGIKAETNLTQTMTVTLAGPSDRPELTATVDESPDDSVFRVPDSSATLNIESFTIEGAGSATVDPTLAFPVAGGVQLQGGRTLVGDDPNRKLTQRTGSVYRWSPA